MKFCHFTKNTPHVQILSHEKISFRFLREKIPMNGKSLRTLSAIAAGPKFLYAEKSRLDGKIYDADMTGITVFFFICIFGIF